jgi:hypothetical protein
MADHPLTDWASQPANQLAWQQHAANSSQVIWTQAEVFWLVDTQVVEHMSVGITPTGEWVSAEPVLSAGGVVATPADATPLDAVSAEGLRTGITQAPKMLGAATIDAWRLPPAQRSWVDQQIETATANLNAMRDRVSEQATVRVVVGMQVVRIMDAAGVTVGLAHLQRQADPRISWVR